MNQNWKDFLQQEGATFNHDAISHFGHFEQELHACKEKVTVISPLFHFDILNISGVDALNFLNNQFTNDVKKLSPNKSQYSSYCTPQGRVLANFLLWQTDVENYFLIIPKELAASFQQRLSKYVLRAKVKIENQNNLICISLAGNHTSQLLASICDPAPKSLHDVTHTSEASFICLSNRLLFIIHADKAINFWQCLNNQSLPIGSQSWAWLEIQSGIPLVTAATQEEFTPQMLNLDQIGAVSFDKGCYPGQEIVARTKYLGKLKKQLYRGHIPSIDPPMAGDRLYSNDMQDASGTIVNVAPSPDKGFDILAVIQTNSAESETIHWKSIDGPILKLRLSI